MIQAHNEPSTGVELHTPDMKGKVKHHGAIFVDDRTGHVACDPDEENTTKDMSNCVKTMHKRAHKCGTT